MKHDKLIIILAFFSLLQLSLYATEAPKILEQTTIQTIQEVYVDGLIQKLL